MKRLDAIETALSGAFLVGFKMGLWGYTILVIDCDSAVPLM